MEGGCVVGAMRNAHGLRLTAVVAGSARRRPVPLALVAEVVAMALVEAEAVLVAAGLALDWVGATLPPAGTREA